MNPSFRTFFARAGLALCGIVLALILVETALRVAGAVWLADKRSRNNSLLAHRGSGAVTVLCLGESTTDRQWPRFLEDALAARGATERFTVIDRGITGTNSDAILNDLDNNIRDYRPDIIVVMMGVNEAPGILPWSAARSLRSLRLYKLYALLRARFSGRFRQERRVPDGGGGGDPRAAARAALQAGDASMAVRYYRQAVAAGRADATLLCEAADVFALSGLYGEAARQYVRAISLDPRRAGAYLALGRISAQQGAYGEAARYYETARSLGCVDPQTAADYADLLYRAGERERADDVLRTVLRTYPACSRAYVCRARHAIGNGDLHEAAALCSALERRRPTEPEALMNLSELYLYTGQVARALQACRAAQREAGGNALVERSLDELQRYMSEIREFRALPHPALSPADEADWLAREAFMHTGNRNAVAATALIERALQLDPLCVRAHAARAQLYRRFGNDAYAIRCLEQSIAVTPASDLSVSLASLYYEQGDLKQVAAVQRRARKNIDCAGMSRFVCGEKVMRNYRRLIDTARRQGIAVVCMQYPLLDTGPLTRGLKGYEDDVWIVSNRERFEEAVARRGMPAVFRDLFAGCFGHCTEEGNQLIAAGVAETIMRIRAGDRPRSPEGRD